MEVRSREQAEPFTTRDGSTIRVLLDAELGGAANQSLAEAWLEPGQATERHYHARTEELYVLLDGEGEMEVEGERARVGPGAAILIPAGAWHNFSAYSPDLPGCVATGETREECETAMREAIALHIEALRSNGESLPPSTSTAAYVDV